MSGSTYFDFLDHDFFHLDQYEEDRGFYQIIPEITNARLRYEEGVFYVAARVAREITEHIFIPAYEEKYNITKRDYEKSLKRNESINLFTKIKYISEKHLTSKEASIYHRMRRIGNRGVHTPNTITKNQARDALRLLDESFRAYIKKFIDSSYSYNIKSRRGGIGLSFQQTVTINNEVIELAPDNQLKEEADQIQQDLTLIQSMQESAEKMLTKTKTGALHSINKLQAELTYRLLSINKEILKESDWIYKILHADDAYANKEQKRAILANNKTYKINGAAGTGKSLVLLAKALRDLSEQEDLKKGIFFTYNKAFMGYIKNILADLKEYEDTSQALKDAIDRLTVINFDKYFFDLSGDYKDFSQIEGSYSDKINHIIEFFTDKDIASYDLVAIDEAQDFSIDRVKLCYRLRKDHDNARFYIAYDENQDIYRSGFSAKLIDEELNFRGNAVTLKKNMRNHVNIEDIAEEILQETIKTIEDLEKNGTNDQVKVISKEVFMEKIEDKGDSAAILCVTNQTKEKLQKELHKKLSIEEITDQNAGRDGLFIGTAHSSKGLEYDRIYIYEFPSQDFERNLRYVSCTRARHELIFVK